MTNLSSLKKIEKDFKSELKKVKNVSDVEKLEIKYLGKKSKITSLLRSLKDIDNLSERRNIGTWANELRKRVKDLIEERKRDLLIKEEERILKEERVDIMEPGYRLPKGKIHILSKVIGEVEDIFSKMGFKIADGPEVETEDYNFNALNIPPNHPARDLWDTFWLEKKNYLLRTHTSPVQVRYMKTHNPPFRIIVPGKVFRYEATDASHEVQFYQLEGMMVGEDVSLANLKAVLEEFFRNFFSKGVELRFRPSYFPFTEPSVEVDIRREGDKEWLEVVGGGMVHPNVFLNAGYNPENWQGFAFGAGIDRLAMIKYNIPDIRLFYSGDLRFIKQF